MLVWFKIRSETCLRTHSDSYDNFFLNMCSSLKSWPVAVLDQYTKGAMTLRPPLLYIKLHLLHLNTL